MAGARLTAADLADEHGGGGAGAGATQTRGGSTSYVALSPWSSWSGCPSSLVSVRERRDEHGRLSDYAVARREPGRDTVFCGGGKLAADLSLPKLRSRWAASGDRAPAQGSRAQSQQEVRAALWEQSTTTPAQAAEEVRKSDNRGALDAAEVLAAAGPRAARARDEYRVRHRVAGRLQAGPVGLGAV